MITVAIPTYNRGDVLLETLESLRRLAPDEILVVDQTANHPDHVSTALAAADDIRWIRLAEPSIPHAMNVALTEASNELILFLDDDVIPSDALVRAHIAAHTGDASLWAVVGQVLQPGEEPSRGAHRSTGLVNDLSFRFSSDTASAIENVMAGNLSIKRTLALRIGGFDENFVGVAYRFETDFARRVIAAGGHILFEPAASLRHLKAPSGGTRMWGDHRTSTSPMHSVGDYYFARRHVTSFWTYVLRRLRSNVLTRFHLMHPWAVIPKLIGEVRGFLLARRLVRRDPTGE